MRLTVGPHPAAVYWRRRVVVLVALAIVVLAVFYAFGGTLSNAGSQPSSAATPSATSTLLRPTSPSPSPKPTPSPTAFTLPPATALSTACTDAEISVAVEAGAAQVQQGEAVNFSISFKNVSSRTCSRDVGADVQEIRLLAGTMIIWSSDDCNPNTGHDIRAFAAGKEVSFTRLWTGLRSRSGTGGDACDSPPENRRPDAGKYTLVGRLDQILSSPFTVTIGAPS